MSGRVCSFPPVARADARVLILGSMPGTVSLVAHQYYAHPYNQFWHIMGVLCDAGRDLPYARRLVRLQERGIALWDVFESCTRPGSLDASIEHSTAIVNDIPELLQRCPHIASICCNGTTSYTAFKRHLSAPVARLRPNLRIERLPSTSPANASWSAARKLAAWRAELGDCLRSWHLSAEPAAAMSTAAGTVRYKSHVRTRRLAKPCP